VLRAERLCVARGARDLFADLDWMLDRGDRVGLVGPNGAGKSTLLRVLAGEIVPDSGSVRLARGERVGYLPQEGIVHEGQPLLREALAGMRTLTALKADIEASVNTMHAAAPEDPAHAKALALHDEAESAFRALGGYSMEADATRVLRGLGFRDADLTRECAEFSGGWQMRIALAKLLLEGPDVLLLDEPTNHLDIEARTWLEHFLSSYRGAVVVVSHDRTFLDRVVRKICELSGAKLTTYTGTFTAYVAAREARLELLRKQYAEQQDEIKRQELFIRRFRAKESKASQVQSRVKMLEKIERIELPPSEARVRFRFPPAPRCGPAPLALSAAAKRYGRLVVFEDAHFTIARGERICLAGPNGAGKSTLLRLLAEREALDNGEVVRDRSARVAYFAQDQALELEPDDSVLDATQCAAPQTPVAEVRSLLGAFLFRGDDVHKPCRVLSGGERNRVALARVLLQSANVLLLDEPTNHLDLQAKETLREALSAYDGAVAFVSHDRDFVDSIATTVVEVGGGALRRFEMGFEAFLWKRAVELGYRGSPAPGLPAPDLWFLRGTEFFDEERGDASEPREGASSAAAPKPRLGFEERRKLQRRAEALRKRVADAEAQSAGAERELAALDARLAAPEMASDHQKLATLLAEREALVEKNDRATAEWEAAMHDLETLDRSLEENGGV
jgi:ATP-binding cassette subfamily F protein 3